jgi:hypothetical protein
MNDNRPGCLGGLLRLALLGWVFDWLQDRFGFGKGCSCSGLGCGLILLIIFVALACTTIFNVDWFRPTLQVLSTVI